MDTPDNRSISLFLVTFCKGKVVLQTIPLF